MLIVEGPDMVGKTTLCKRLVKELNDRFMPHVYRWFSKLPECWDYYHDYLPNISRFAVQDRFHMSEIAYRLCCGEMPRLQPEVYRLLDAKVRLAGGFTVVITAEKSFIEKQWKELADREMHSLDQIQAVNGIFFNYANIKTAPVASRPDIDMHYHLNGCFPADNDNLVNLIVERYCQRYNAMETLNNRRMYRGAEQEV